MFNSYKKQYDEVLHYCTCDVEALFPIFDMLMTRFKSKYIIARLGNIDEEYALSLTDANLTAVLLGAKRKEHDDNFAYVYPDVIDKSKISHPFISSKQFSTLSLYCSFIDIYATVTTPKSCSLYPITAQESTRLDFIITSSIDDG